MKVFRIVMMLLLALAAKTLSAQDATMVDPLPVRLQGKVVSTADGMPIPYANIVNVRTHGGTSSNSRGYFIMDMLNVDSLFVSAMGYLKQTFAVPYNYNSDSVFTINLQPVVFSISEVEVTGEKRKVNLDGVPAGKPVDIAPEMRGDAFNERPPVIAALFNPLSYMQYYLSKEESRKRKVRQAIAVQKKWESFSLNYNKEMVMNLTGMNEEQADDFMAWFNAQNVLPYSANEYEVRASIKEYFGKYVREGLLNRN